MNQGRQAMDLKRYEAAYLYFARALSLDPSSSEARSAASEALWYAKKYPSRESTLTEKERQLPPVPENLQSAIEAEMRKTYQSGADEPDREPEIPIPEESGREEIPGEGREYVPPEDRPRDPVERPSERPEIVRPGLTTVLGIATRISLAPLVTGWNNLFHTLIHIPPFEGVRTLDDKVWYVESGYEYSLGEITSGRYGPGTTDLILRYENNIYHEGYIKIAHGLLEHLEARLTISTGNLREGDGDILLVDYATSPETVYVEDYDRRADIGNLIASVKWNVFRALWDWPEKDPESGISMIFDVKIPLATNPKNFTSSGGFDFSYSLVSSFYLGKLIFFPLVFHGTAGLTLPVGERYFSEDVDLDPVFFAAVGADMKFAGWGVLVAQIQANTSAFTEFDPLKGLVLTHHAGIRLMVGHFFMETSLGFPLTDTSSTLTFTLHFGLHFMGKQREEEIVT
jgi:hypothetical protein